MKKYISISIILVAIASGSLFIINEDKDEMKICHSEIIWIKENGTPNGITLKSKINIQISDNHNGRMNFYGYIKNEEAVYRLDRAIYFSYTPVDKKGNYEVEFNKSLVTNADNTPNSMFSNFIELEKDKTKYYISVTKMEDDLYILRDEAYSSFTCYIE
ncbi:hypothetical protein GKR50_07265 [Providencia rustigianii]|uniref:FidL-like protein n=1 Tax=Providencia rustigianii TaxID=158850 RepID=UPI000F6BFF5F|nr:FidL-like protein [Providencia rustigianii]MTC59813.1 hypothetical protein [Providencia rustigianii]VEH53612.1 Uncharacterised protein [Providencia rustigianii]